MKLLSQGKVRDLFELSSQELLIVATDRISAFDCVLGSLVPGKGRILTSLSAFWFNTLATTNHCISTHTPTISLRINNPQLSDDLDGRAMLVRRLEILPIEAIVRGYLSGSAWKEYTKNNSNNPNPTSVTVFGHELPKGMLESQKIDPEPIFTPSTKAEIGDHDENITFDRMKQIVGDEMAERVKEASLRIYKQASEYALKRGIIIADTKFEFGIDEQTGELVLADEVLTPDSSRFWSLDKYAVGRAQDSFDKQGLRDWLLQNGLDGKPGIELPPSVVEETLNKYRTIARLLME